MLGTTPLSFCDGPNRDTGPHTPACLDFLWRTSGLTTTPSSGSIPPYGFCTAAGTSAPLNANGTPNENNIARANNLGSVANVKAQYKALYDAAQNTNLNSENFPTWATAMRKCYNVNAVEPVTDPDTCNRPSVAGINIMEVSYGKNCNPGLQGNRTSLFQSLANGQTNFNYLFNFWQTGGDPAGGCPKTLEFVYNCDGGDPKTFIVPPEAGVGGRVALSCGPSPPPVPGINIMEASYGKNCNSALQGNRTPLFQSLANGQTNFNYVFDYWQTGGDPAGGCGKTLEILYNCSGSNPKTFTVPPEAGVGGRVALSCG